MNPPARLATALRAHAQGLCCLEAAAELLISQSWLHRADFTSQFVRVQRGLADGPEMAAIDWPADHRPGSQPALLRRRAANAEDHSEPG